MHALMNERKKRIYMVPKKGIQFHGMIWKQNAKRTNITKKTGL